MQCADDGLLVCGFDDGLPFYIMDRKSADDVGIGHNETLFK